jgi:hypothetical protein
MNACKSQGALPRHVVRGAWLVLELVGGQTALIYDCYMPLQ